MTALELTDLLSPRRLNACPEARKWAEGRTLAEAWRDCERGDWLLWLAARVGVRRETVVLAACDCARLALPHVPPGEERPRRAIETAEAWARGEASIAEVRAAADAADAADAAAYDAAASAADAIDTDTWDTTHARCADLVRARISVADIVEAMPWSWPIAGIRLGSWSAPRASTSSSRGWRLNAMSDDTRISELREAIRLAIDTQRRAYVCEYALRAELDRLQGDDLYAEWHAALADCYRLPAGLPDDDPRAVAAAARRERAYEQIMEPPRGHEEGGEEAVPLCVECRVEPREPMFGSFCSGVCEDAGETKARAAAGLPPLRRRAP